MLGTLCSLALYYKLFWIVLIALVNKIKHSFYSCGRIVWPCGSVKHWDADMLLWNKRLAITTSCVCPTRKHLSLNRCRLHCKYATGHLALSPPEASSGSILFPCVSEAASFNEVLALTIAAAPCVLDIRVWVTTPGTPKAWLWFPSKPTQSHGSHKLCEGASNNLLFLSRH